MNSGIYQIRNVLTDKRYIGSSVDILRRFKEHTSLLKEQGHNRYFQVAWNKYKEESFKFEVIEYCPKDLLFQREQYWMDYYQSYKSENGYNLNDKATGVSSDIEVRRQIGRTLTGRKHSKETIEKRKNSIRRTFLLDPNYRKKLSETSRGRECSLETRKKLSKTSKGRVVSEETRLKIGKTLKGRKLSPEALKNLREVCSSDAHREKIRNGYEKYRNSPEYLIFVEKQRLRYLGKPLSEETKQKMRLALKGRKVTEETKHKLHLSHLGMTHSDETKKKLRLLNLGKKFTIEMKRKLSQSLKGKKKSFRTLEHTKNFQASVKHTINNKKQISLYKKLFPNNYGQLLNVVNY